MCYVIALTVCAVCRCLLHNKSEAELYKLGECPLDPGGYFIVRVSCAFKYNRINSHSTCAWSLNPTITPLNAGC
jgi:hypothetical protein